jgi:bile acid:Na+ symporter, BASS family
MSMPPALSFLPVTAIGLLALSCVFMAMTALGSSVNPLNVRRVLPEARQLALALLVALVAVPVITLGLASFMGLSGAALVGLLLVGISPGAPLALRKSRDAGSEAAFATALQVAIALFAIVAVPAWIMILDYIYTTQHGITLEVLARQVFVAQLLPLACGMAIGFWVPALAQRLFRPLLRLSALLLLALGLLVISQAWQALLDVPPRAALTSVGVVASALALGHWVSGPSLHTRAAGAIVCAMRNPGIALLVASVNGLPTGAKVIVIAHILITVLGVLGYLLAVKRLDRAAKATVLRTENL